MVAAVLQSESCVDWPQDVGMDGTASLYAGSALTATAATAPVPAGTAPKDTGSLFVGHGLGLVRG